MQQNVSNTDNQGQVLGRHLLWLGIKIWELTAFCGG